MAPSQLFPTSENSNSLCQSKGKKCFEDGVHQTRQKETQLWPPPCRWLPLSSAPPAPTMNTSSLESTAALVASWSTPNLWPLTPSTQNSSQRRRLSSPSGEHILWVATMTTEGSDSEYRCYRCSLHRLLFFFFFSLYFLHIVHNHTKSSTQSFMLWICGCGCFHVTVGPICPDAPWLEKKILLFLDGKLPATERSGYKSAALSSLLKKHVPARCTFSEKK